MSPRSKREYLEAIIVRYRKAARKVETAILDEFCSACTAQANLEGRLYALFQATQIHSSLLATWLRQDLRAAAASGSQSLTSDLSSHDRSDVETGPGQISAAWKG